MALQVRFLPAARMEYLEALNWYEQRSTQIADAFVAEMDRKIQLIAENPQTFQAIVEDVRRVRLRRFPYSLLFRVADDACFVIACFHGRRDPKSWQER
jgi:plasmid stabilization system protein ParE